MKYFACIWLLVIAVVFNESKSMELPSNFKTCKRGAPNYTECIAEAAADAVISMANGLKQFKILPIEPLRVDKVTIKRVNAVVSFKQIYENVKIHGLTKGLKNLNYEVDFDNLVLRWTSFNPQIDFIANYTLDGKFIAIPITGHGHSNITMLGSIMKNVVYCEKYEQDGETFLRVERYDVTFSPTKALLQFDNLSCALLGEHMNQFLNDNSDLLFEELQGAYEKTFSKIFKKIANDIFSRVPMNKIFPVE